MVGTARTTAALPTAVPEIAYGLLWLWLFNPLYGPINQLLRLGGENGLTVFGRTPPQWLTDPTDAQAAIILMSLFTMGEMFIILLAARRALPHEAYELAAIEDATGVGRVPPGHAAADGAGAGPAAAARHDPELPVLVRAGARGDRRRAAAVRAPPTCRCSSTATRSSTCDTATPRRRRSSCWR